MIESEIDTKTLKAKDWRLLSSENFQNYQLEYVANIEYNSLILYPSHYWHSVYIKEDWFTDTDRVTFTGFFETKTTSSKQKIRIWLNETNTRNY